MNRHGWIQPFCIFLTFKCAPLYTNVNAIIPKYASDCCFWWVQFGYILIYTTECASAYFVYFRVRRFKSQCDDMSRSVLVVLLRGIVACIRDELKYASARISCKMLEIHKREIIYIYCCSLVYREPRNPTSNA